MQTRIPLPLLRLIPLLGSFLFSCRPPLHTPPRPPSVPTARESSAALFEEVAEKAGLHFLHTNGFAEKFYFHESLPSGCAFLDYDNDGYLDIFLVQGGSSEPHQTVSNRPHCALYRNNGNGTFTDVTLGSGLDKDLGYGHGVAVGDYDNDGYDDLFVTAYGVNHLFHNERGTGRFTDVTARMGLDRVHSTGYATSAAFGDYNLDGRLDLYVCYYSTWSHSKDQACMDASGQPEYCSPEIYEPDTHRLFRNDGHRFTDVSQAAGIAQVRGRGLAVAFLDYNQDGKPDIFVANDMTPNMLWKNRGDGTFEETAALAGCAFNGEGAIMAGMGIAIADYDHSGRESLYVTDFSGKMNALFQNRGNALFTDVAPSPGVGLSSTRNFLAFGCEFLDYDADGWQDLIISNGHVNYRIENSQTGITYQERKQLFHNEGGVFREITDPQLLGDLNTPRLGRGLAVGDYDNDGRLDILALNQNERPQLLRNRDRSGHHWVAFKPIGAQSNRNGVHAHFTLLAGGVRQTATVRGGSSFLSSSDRRVYFGLGSSLRIDSVTIRWPSGRREVLKNLAPNAGYIVTEGRGVTGQLPTAGAGGSRPDLKHF